MTSLGRDSACPLHPATHRNEAFTRRRRRLAEVGGVLIGPQGRGGAVLAERAPMPHPSADRGERSSGGGDAWPKSMASLPAPRHDRGSKQVPHRSGMSDQNHVDSLSRTCSTATRRCGGQIL